jgi:hypothetical protein
MLSFYLLFYRIGNQKIFRLGRQDSLGTFIF